MKRSAGILSALMLAAALSTAPLSPAKADGGAVVIGVGVYLGVDYIVGRKCHMKAWPFNMVKQVVYGLHHKRVCKRY